ncbi:hypothetical protein SAMN05446635_3554 [Burkholderia sp. OK233]|nr:hypothetical protein SAMN05446635_3554 [Burkholderia sp. OK233]
MGNQGLRLRAVGAIGFASAMRLCIHRGTPLQIICQCEAIIVPLSVPIVIADAVAVPIRIAMVMAVQ